MGVRAEYCDKTGLNERGLYPAMISGGKPAYLDPQRAFRAESGKTCAFGSLTRENGFVGGSTPGPSQFAAATAGACALPPVLIV
jgi:hypothetical protein